MKKVELLAPAKDFETAVSAINSGADAVYIGANSFGARHNAANAIDEIKKLIDYAHKFYVRVHVTVNTILNDNEVPQAIKLINELYNIGVDAVIVQDTALLKAAIEGKIPPVQIHASTQCDNRTLEKVKFFDKIGLSRVILARELSLETIKEICQNTQCEIETFIHGALCVSYSGQCYLSYANGGRSANRGECAQPCRKKYSLVNSKNEILVKDKYLLSLKDFNASKHIEKLISCGVKSFKIEGRLKDKNYVKNVTAYYNILLNKFAQRTSSGRIFIDFEPDLYKTFNRSYTDYFLKKRGECFNFLTPKSMGEKAGKVTKVFKNYFETDGKFHPQDGLLFINSAGIEGCLVNKTDGNKIFPAKMPKIKTGDIIYRNFNSEFDKKLTNSKITRKIGVKFNIANNILTATDEDNNSATVNLAQNEPSKNIEKARENYVKQLSKTGESEFFIKEVNIKDAALPFMKLSELNNIRREILEKLMNERIKNYPRLKQKPLCYSDYPIKNLDYRANILNNEAKKFYENCGCETIENALEKSKNIPHGIELMRTKHCIKYACGYCGKNSDKLYLRDENGKKYPLVFDCKNCEMAVLNP